MSDWRDDAIEAGARALTEAWLTYADDDNDELAAAVVDAVAERIRADERERTNTVRGHRLIGAEARDDLLNDLRESVVALEDAGCARVIGGCNCRRSEALRDVLALLEDGAQ